MEQFHFFWSGIFSQWYSCIFVIDNIQYNCAEQYMMASKARIFDDSITLNKIMASKSPKTQKALGRKVNNFNEKIWLNHAIEVVYQGNYAKFTQNEKLKYELLKHYGKTLVEASPYDCIWGIGLSETDPRALSRDTWKGLNYLGEILTQVCNDLYEIEHANQ